MRCSNCGYEVGESPFCPNCGADLTSKVRSRRRFLRNVDRGVRHGAAAAITLVAVISVLAVVLSAMPAGNVEDGPTNGQFSVPSDAVEIDDGFFLFRDGGFDDGSIEAEINDQGHPVFYVSQEVRQGCTQFVWIFRDESTATAYPITKTVENYPEDAYRLEWIEPQFGDWSLTVICSSPDGDTVLTGSVAYYGDRSVELTWSHGGRTLSVTQTITAEEFFTAAMDQADRSKDGPGDAAAFVSPESVAALESLVWSAYSSSFTFARTSSDYASCLIGMVSSCIETTDDLTLYGESVRWAYPVETVYRGYGDSGDKAVLAASLLEAAGFDTALVHVPDMWAVGVADVLPSSSQVDGYAVLTAASGGAEYRVCDVVTFCGIGMMPDCYGYDGRLTYRGSPLSGDFGIVRCSA